ncbi:hypothetical protein CEXT_554011 [Caerostris extrusa]|uniref:Uncharacterized protein n=1 Tax=Caerostris extrusa TaxID=172846 RepID=A0AAV4PB83_CAEEX|nr:hypothetical protein CEXT_554011 [Caerostris extrusa]
MRKRRFSDAQRRYMVNENQALIKSCLLSYSNYVTGFSNSPDIHFSPSACYLLVLQEKTTMRGSRNLRQPKNICTLHRQRQKSLNCTLFIPLGLFSGNALGLHV